MENLFTYAENQLFKKEFGYGLHYYSQANCQVSLTDNGMRIYRPPNLTVAANGSTMWGGMKLVPSSQFGTDTITKGHTYIVKWHVSGKTSCAATSIGWTNNMGWGGGGLMPAPTKVAYLYPPANFEGEMDCFYKFTVTDDVRKVCTSAYGSFVKGETYLSYKDFMMGWVYESTGSLGTDIYVTNIRMYDITDTESEAPSVTKSGIVICGNTMERTKDCSFSKGNEILLKEIYEI